MDVQSAAQTAVSQGGGIGSYQVQASAQPVGGVVGTAGKSGQPQRGIAPAIAKIFGSSIAPDAHLSVSFRVARAPDEIVTVFSDPQTGDEVVQFPPELMLKIAEFFDQHAGVALDTNA
ncbi:MAG: hypothetical protein ACYDA5_02090 [Vulcanimicrobiaceae bacterium]